MRRGAVVTLIIISVFTFYWFHWDALFTLETLKTQHAKLISYTEIQPIISAGLYFLLYVATTALSLPGATVLTLAAGAIFGLIPGTIIVSVASTLGATGAFLVSRYLFRDTFTQRFGKHLQTVQMGIEKDGAYYLFAIRLMPIFPFFLINILMGLTTMRVWTFLWVSQAGMLAGTIAYVNAGTELSHLSTLSDILNPQFIFAFTLLGLLPLITKKIITTTSYFQRKHRHERPIPVDYNLIVVGAGPAGLVSSYLAAAGKAKVALIEKDKMGGDCLNTGCVPSKTLIEIAKMYHSIGQADTYGIIASREKIDFPQVMKKVRNTIRKIEPHDSVSRYEALGVDCFIGSAKLVSPYQVQINDKTLSANSIIIATGSKPRIPQIPGLEKVPFWTSDNIWSMVQLPNRLLIIGGGPIGCELAQCFSRFGSQVTIIELGPQILPNEDKDVSHFLTEILTHEGICIKTQHTVEAVLADQKVLRCEHQGHYTEVPFDDILISIGRTPNLENLGIEDLGIKVNNKGSIDVDRYLRSTNFPNIFACGDVAGPYQFTHLAGYQASYATLNSLVRPFAKFSPTYTALSRATFCDPEIARVGLNENEAQALKVPYDLTHYTFKDLDKAIIQNKTAGFIKILTKPGKDKIIGVTIVGHQASETISEFTLAMRHNLGLSDILSTLHLYPTLTDANKLAAGVWKKKNTPSWLLNKLKYFHELRRHI